MDLYENIVKLATEKGYTIGGLSQAAKISTAILADLKRGKTKDLSRRTVEKLARVLGVTVEEVYSGGTPKQMGAIPVSAFIPVYGSIPAGEPAFAEQNIMEYVPICNKNPNDYFGLKVRGTSMIGARITDGSTVIIQRQPCAEDGDIVACRINGDEATLKRFKRQGNTILLLPENPEYEPRIVPAEAFENGEAEILGVVRQILISI